MHGGITKMAFRHDIRPIDEIRTIMRGMADRCEKGVPNEEVKPLFDEALDLMLEMRVPRMPSDDEALRTMIGDAASDDDAGVTTQEAFDELRVHGLTFARRVADYREALSTEEWKDAAEMLMPHDGGMITWEGGPYTLETVGDGTVHRVEIERAEGASMVATAGNEGLAMLAALLRAHDEWPHILRR